MRVHEAKLIPLDIRPSCLEVCSILLHCTIKANLLFLLARTPTKATVAADFCL